MSALKIVGLVLALIIGLGPEAITVWRRFRKGGGDA